jgi:hypothetical protein
MTDGKVTSGVNGGTALYVSKGIRILQECGDSANVNIMTNLITSQWTLYHEHVEEKRVRIWQKGLQEAALYVNMADGRR